MMTPIFNRAGALLVAIAMWLSLPTAAEAERRKIYRDVSAAMVEERLIALPGATVTAVGVDGAGFIFEVTGPALIDGAGEITRPRFTVMGENCDGETARCALISLIAQYPVAAAPDRVHGAINGFHINNGLGRVSYYPDQAMLALDYSFGLFGGVSAGWLDAQFDIWEAVRARFEASVLATIAAE